MSIINRIVKNLPRRWIMNKKCTVLEIGGGKKTNCNCQLFGAIRFCWLLFSYYGLLGGWHRSVNEIGRQRKERNFYIQDESGAQALAFFPDTTIPSFLLDISPYKGWLFSFVSFSPVSSPIS